MVRHTCKKCGKSFSHKAPYDYHVNKKKIPCSGYSLNSNSPNNSQTSSILVQKYYCSSCNRSFANKSNLNKHNRRFHPSTERTNSRTKFIEHSELDADNQTNKNCRDLTMHKKSSFQVLTNSCTKKTTFDTFSALNNTINEKSTITCNYCHKTFTRNSSLNRHIDNVCKVKKQIDQEKHEIFTNLVKQLERQNQQMEKQNKEIKQLKKEISSFKGGKQVNNNCHYTTNNTNTTNNTQINNNIKLVAFGQEDLSSIQPDISKTILKKGFQSVPSLTKYIHFNKNKPENHNIYIPNMRDKHAMVFTGSNWGLTGKKEIIDQIYDDKKQYLDEKYDELTDSLDNITKKKYGRFRDQEQEAIKRIKEDINLLLYNSRHVPMETRKMIKN